MGLKLRLIIMNFLQFFVWGAWLTTISVYWFNNKVGSVTEFGAIFTTLGIASLFMPTLMGIVADRWMNAEKLYGILHILSGLSVFMLTKVDNPHTFFWIMLVAMIFYMPTIALSNSIAYNAIKAANFDVVKDFPPIRVWGTIGFIVAMWVINLSGNMASANQFIISSALSIALGIYSFTLPKCRPQGAIQKGSGLLQTLGLDAFKLFANYKIALFFVFSMLLGAALQLTNMYGTTFLNDFKTIYPDSFVVEYSAIVMSISQISEVLFIITIPFFLKRFGIKNVMLMSMAAWVLRFALFGFSNPDDRLWMIILSMMVYGMAFDFFNISGSMFIETTTSPKMRSSAQGLFMMMTNGFGAIIGSSVSGVIIGKFFTSADGHKDWPNIWFTFAAYALVVGVLFAIMFKHKHDPKEVENIKH